jgi:curved DNA-binding protein CbpA
MKTHYEVLGVDRQAPIADIAQRYRHHLSQHVVSNQNRVIRKKDQRRLQRMREAYLLLSSPSRRRVYDVQLEQLERARRRWYEAAAMAACVAMLVVGTWLILRGYWGMREHEAPAAPQVAHTANIAKADGSSAPFTLSGMLFAIVGHAPEKGVVQRRD